MIKFFDTYKTVNAKDHFLFNAIKITHFPLNILLLLIFVQCYETTDILLFKQSLTRHWKGSHIYSYSANKSIKKIQKYTVYISDAVPELVGLSDIEPEGS